MKKQIGKIIFAACMIWVAAITASYAGPQIEIEEPVFLFGSVPEGTIVTHNFSIKNSGNQVLKILRVVTSCGCTVADYPKTVAPGKTGFIHVKANTSGYGGKSFKKQLFVRTDIPGRQPVRLQLAGTVER